MRQFTSNLENAIYHHLLQKGFPSDSIVYEPGALKVKDGRLYNPDFLIVDPVTNEYLAVIEVKSKVADLSRAKEQLEAYKKALGDQRIATYLITGPEDVPDMLSILGTDADAKEKDVDPELLPNFKALKASNVANKKSKIVSEQDETTKALRRTGSILAAIIFIITAADFALTFWDLKLLTTERLTLLGVAMILIILPYFQKFKGLGIEWERITGNNTNKSDKDKE
jgi:hypothetical protein